MVRPRTSQPRGICKYYATPRGCFAGNTCKFLHATPEQAEAGSSSSQPLLTPYDAAKVCRFYAAGYCKRGEECWFKHSEPSVPPATEDICGICLEKPIIYGLLTGCSHVFCLPCLRQWRDPKGKEASGSIVKKCPLCRASSDFIMPASRFFPLDDPQRAALQQAYEDSMRRVSCHHFERSPPNRRYCPFGKDCFYTHKNADGTPFEFPFGKEHYMRVRHLRQNNRDLGTEGFLRDIEIVTSMLSDLVLPPETPQDATNGDGPAHPRGTRRANATEPELNWESILNRIPTGNLDVQGANPGFMQDIVNMMGSIFRAVRGEGSGDGSSNADNARGSESTQRSSSRPPAPSNLDMPD